MIPKEVWHLKEEWTNLGRNIMDFQDVFLKTLASEEAEFLDFEHRGRGLINMLAELHARTGEYIKEYNKSQKQGEKIE